MLSIYKDKKGRGLYGAHPTYCQDAKFNVREYQFSHFLFNCDVLFI